MCNLCGWVFAPGEVFAGMQSNEAAAWVQAIGSIIAIFIAIGVPAWQESLRRKGERQDRARHARALSMRMLRIVQKLARSSARSFKRLDAADDRVDWLITNGADIGICQPTLDYNQWTDHLHWFDDDADALLNVHWHWDQVSDARTRFEACRGTPFDRAKGEPAAEVLRAAFEKYTAACTKACAVVESRWKGPAE